MCTDTQLEAIDPSHTAVTDEGVFALPRTLRELTVCALISQRHASILKLVVSRGPGSGRQAERAAGSQRGKREERRRRRGVCCVCRCAHSSCRTTDAPDWDCCFTCAMTALLNVFSSALERTLTSCAARIIESLYQT